MAKIHWCEEDYDYVVKEVTRFVEGGYDGNGKLSIEDITDDVKCYNWEDDELEFIEEHKGCKFYQVMSDVVGVWQQPINLIAVEY